MRLLLLIARSLCSFLSYDPGQQGGVSSACCEPRLTWRLVGRLVPFKVVPLFFVGAGDAALTGTGHQFAETEC